ncbi:MAG TPA: NAD(P)H-binding protein [Pedococcus sp.]|nr:NAD(P)H-binding protein [Pedococcus sp.]
MRVVVTGAAGDLGWRVGRELTRRGHTVVPASRRTGVDLATGDGLDAVLSGADAVVHCATNPRRARAVDVEGTRRITTALARQDDPAHLVAISIVGCDLVPFGYYRAKADAERLIETSAIPATVVRATQFHALAAFLARVTQVGRMGITLRDLTLRPVDIGWVASRLVDHAVGPRPTGPERAVDLVGPDILSIPELAAAVAAHDDRPTTRFVRVPPVGRAMRGLSAGALISAGEVERGGRSFSEWLATQPHPLPRGMHDRS